MRARSAPDRRPTSRARNHAGGPREFPRYLQCGPDRPVPTVGSRQDKSFEASDGMSNQNTTQQEPRRRLGMPYDFRWLLHPRQLVRARRRSR